MIRDLIDRWRYRKFNRFLRERGYGPAKRMRDTSHRDFPGLR